jgi:hypothetical protein
MNTKTSEYQLFANNNLVKVAENTYQVEKSESLTELYDKLTKWHGNERYCL